MPHYNIRFSGDPHSNSGAWSPPTSRANFCEEDYVVTFYLAEFINALTNIAYVYLALRSMYSGPLPRRLLAPKWDFMSASLLALGIGSFLFHATLRQTLEFVDEFGMLGLSWSMLHATLTTRQPAARARAITLALAVFHLAFSGFYIWSAQIIHQVYAFVGSIIAVSLRSQYVYYQMRPRLPAGRSRDWNVRAWSAAAVCLLGYLLWTVDLEQCAWLRALRLQIGLPWAWLLELHGWWHVLTAVGASMFMQVVREMREEAERERKED